MPGARRRPAFGGEWDARHCCRHNFSALVPNCLEQSHSYCEEQFGRNCVTIPRKVRAGQRDGGVAEARISQWVRRSARRRLRWQDVPSGCWPISGGYAASHCPLRLLNGQDPVRAGPAGRLEQARRHFASRRALARPDHRNKRAGGSGGSLTRRRPIGRSAQTTNRGAPRSIIAPSVNRSIAVHWWRRRSWARLSAGVFQHRDRQHRLLQPGVRLLCTHPSGWSAGYDFADG